MSQRLLLASPMFGLVIFVLAPAPPPAANPQEHLAPAKAKLDAVRRVHQLKAEMRKRGEAGVAEVPEQDYVWSRRLLEAERDAGGKMHDDHDALDAHLDRMKQLEALVKQSHRVGEASALHVAAAEYYRLEAEFWLAQAKAE